MPEPHYSIQRDHSDAEWIWRTDPGREDHPVPVVPRHGTDPGVWALLVAAVQEVGGDE